MSQYSIIFEEHAERTRRPVEGRSRLLHLWPLVAVHRHPGALMKRTVALALAVSALARSACGGDDDVSADSVAPTPRRPRRLPRQLRLRRGQVEVGNRDGGDLALPRARIGEQRQQRQIALVALGMNEHPIDLVVGGGHLRFLRHRDRDPGERVRRDELLGDQPAEQRPQRAHPVGDTSRLVLLLRCWMNLSASNLVSVVIPPSPRQARSLSTAWR